MPCAKKSRRVMAWRQREQCRQPVSHKQLPEGSKTSGFPPNRQHPENIFLTPLNALAGDPILQPTQAGRGKAPTPADGARQGKSDLDGAIDRGSDRKLSSKSRRTDGRCFSEFEGEPLSDFVDPLLERIESGVHRLVVKVENITSRQERENPVVGLDIIQHLLDRVPERSYCTRQNVHRIPRFKLIQGPL